MVGVCLHEASECQILRRTRRKRGTRRRGSKRTRRKRKRRTRRRVRMKGSMLT